MKAMPYHSWRCMLVACVLVGVLAGTGRIAHAATLICTAQENLGATCTTSGDSKEGSSVSFSCKLPGGETVGKTCIRLYSPIWGETRTCVRGYNWQCDGGLIVHDSQLADTKTMCTKLCGICAGAWK